MKAADEQSASGLLQEEAGLRMHPVHSAQLVEAVSSLGLGSGPTPLLYIPLKYPKRIRHEHNSTAKNPIYSTTAGVSTTRLPFAEAFPAVEVWPIRSRLAHAAFQGLVPGCHCGIINQHSPGWAHNRCRPLPDRWHRADHFSRRAIDEDVN